jgi:hypothetical protein
VPLPDAGHLLSSDPYAPAKPASSADLNAAIARVTPDVLTLLGDGVARTRGAILAALADRHPRDDLKRTLMA